MSIVPPARRTPPTRPSVTPLDTGLGFNVGTARYRNDAELSSYAAAFRPMTSGRLAVVVGITGTGSQVATDLSSANARVVLTADALGVDPELVPGWFEPDPFRAVLTAVAGLEQGDALVMLLPADWEGPSPESLVDHARRWRATPHSPVDDEFFAAAPLV